MPLKQSPKLAAPPSSGSSKLILLGEDDIDDEELLKEVFMSIDPSFSLIFVHNGKDVVSTLAKMEEELPCLIILDYNMPALNGSEILRELKKQKKLDSIPKMIWSTSNSDTYKNICLELGACDYVIKPTSMQGLLEVARYMLSFCTVH